jgi:hypothetical protein
MRPNRSFADHLAIEQRAAGSPDRPSRTGVWTVQYPHVTPGICAGTSGWMRAQVLDTTTEKHQQKQWPYAAEPQRLLSGRSQVQLRPGAPEPQSLCMKLRQAHVVRLATQTVAILRDPCPLTGRGRDVFPSPQSRDRPMSENAITAALRSMGYSGQEVTRYGFRTIASTCLNELGWHADLIELQLAHAKRNEWRKSESHTFTVGCLMAEVPHTQYSASPPHPPKPLSLFLVPATANRSYKDDFPA